MIALSWSRISDFRSCPHKFRLKYLDKAPNFQLKDEDKSPALVRGGNIHKQLERYVTLKVNDNLTGNEVWDPSVQKTLPLVDGILGSFNVMPERQIAIDQNFQAVDWYSKQAWFRVIYDIIGFGKVLLLGDYKTGKLADYEGSIDTLGQLHMSAVVGMTLWPEYDKCASLYIYVDHKKTVPVDLDREEHYEVMKSSLIDEHGRINEEKEFPEKKNRYCCYCDATPQQCIHKRK